MKNHNEIHSIAQELIAAKHAYYNTEHPIMSDAEYDRLEDKLRRLDPEHPVLKSVGTPPDENGWKKVAHQIPMGSLSKAKTPMEFGDWANGIPLTDGSLFWSDKLDGLSVEIVYEKGVLVEASSRGTGKIGDEITINVLKMGGVKRILPLPYTGSLRGEIVMFRKAYKEFFSTYKNTRNAVSGISKRHDGSGCENLNVLFYEAIFAERDFEFESQQLEFIQNELGLHTPNFGLITAKDKKESVQKVVEIWKKYQDEIRDALPYDIDGLVVRANHIPTQLGLGYNNENKPKGAVAFKFEQADAKTVLRNIEQSIGNTGVITPVAIFDPVDLMGATITRASLYNYGYVDELGLDIGAEILVVRANDVIPRVEECLKSTGTVVKTPSQCPVCGAETEMRGEFLVCTNTVSCPAQIAGRIKNWVNTLNLLEWGETLIERLVENGLVTSVYDLYKLTEEDLLKVERMGAKSAQKVLQILHANKNLSLDVFLGALSIPMVGKTIIGLLVSAGYDTLEKIRAMKIEDMLAIDGLGLVKAQLLFDGIRQNKKLIDDLLTAGLSIKEKKGNLKGISICFTGKMTNKRAVLEKMVEDNGGDVKKSVGAGLNYLVIDDVNSTTSKAVAARKHGTHLLSEIDFLRMIGG